MSEVGISVWFFAGLIGMYYIGVGRGREIGRFEGYIEAVQDITETGKLKSIEEVE